MNWYDDQHRILVFRLVSPWNLQEMYEAMDEGTRLSQLTTQPIVIVFDIRESKVFPRNFLSALPHLSKNKDENVLLRVVVGTSVMFRAIYNIVQRIAPGLAENIVLYSNMDDALAYIAKIDTQITPHS